jgi:hypothetical protein
MAGGMTCRRPSSLAALGLTLMLALCAAAPAGAASTTIRSYKPVATKGKTLMFKVRSVRPADVKRARLRTARGTHTISTRSVRAALRRKRLIRARVRSVVASRVRRAFRARRSSRRRSSAGGVRLLLYVRKRSSRGKAQAKPISCDCSTTSSPGATSKPSAPSAPGGRTASTLPGAPSDPGSCPDAFGSFSKGNLPGACWRPYSDASPFNQRLPQSPRLAENSSAMVRTMTGWGKPEHFVTRSAETAGDWVHPHYYSQPGDPVFTVHCLRDWGTCEVEGMQVRIPDAARPAGGGDAHMAVIDQSNGWEYDFWQVKSKPRGGGTITISWGGRTRIGTSDADGLKSDATAAHFGLLAGTIRFPELAAGKINHALFFIIKCDGGGIVYPANGHGSECSDGAPAPHQGSRIFLDMSDAEIDAIDAPYWKKAIYKAMAHYGAFVGDTGGSPWGPKIESGSTYTSFGLTDPWAAWGAAQEGTWDYKNRDYVPWNDDEIDWKSKLKVAHECVSERTC